MILIFWRNQNRHLGVSEGRPPTPHDVQFSCAINQPLLAHHWMVHQCLLTSRFVAASIPWGVSAPGGKMRKQLLKTITLLLIHWFLSLKVLLLIYCFSKSTAYNTFQFEKLFWIWWKVLDTIILWQDVGPCCEQTHADFEVGLSLDQGQGVYSGWSDVVGSSQLRLCHTCILDVMRPKRIPCSYPGLKNTLFEILDEKKGPFQPKSLILRFNKHPLSKQNAIFIASYQIEDPFCESKINCFKYFSR